MITENSIIVVSNDQVYSDLSGEAVILNLNSGIYYGLNAVGARIWKLIQEPKAVKEIRDILLEEYNVERKNCEQDLLALLQHLKTAGLIEVKGETVP